MLRKISGVIDIFLGIFIALVSIFVYYKADYSLLENMHYFFFTLHLIILPTLGLLVLILGLYRLIRTPKQEIE